MNSNLIKFLLLKKNAFILQNKQLSSRIRNQVEPSKLCICFSRYDDISTFLGYDLWIEFFHHSNPGDKKLVRLGAIFRSGVSSHEVLESTLGCVETPAHIPFSKFPFSQYWSLFWLDISGMIFNRYFANKNIRKTK